jgi:hypothetical protein
VVLLVLFKRQKNLEPYYSSIIVLTKENSVNQNLTKQVSEAAASVPVAEQAILRHQCKQESHVFKHILGPLTCPRF